MAAIRVMLACNDHRNGVFTGRLEALQFEAKDGSRVEIYLADRPPRVVHHEFKDGEYLRVGHVVVQCHGWDTWVGNWCWDETIVGLSAARVLLADILASGTFGLEEWTESGPLWPLVKRHLELREQKRDEAALPAEAPKP